MKNKEFNLLAEKYLDTVYRVAVSSCKSEADADDIVQNTFLKLLKRKTKFNNEEHAKRWLIRVAVNEAHLLWRKRQREMEVPETETDFVFSDDLTADDVALMEAINALPDKNRQIIHLYYFEGYSTKEIAQLVNLTPDNVRACLSRARKQLKEILKED